MRRSVGEEQAVNAEIAVMLFLAVVTSVSIFILAVFVINCVVAKLPNTAAHHIC